MDAETLQRPWSAEIATPVDGSKPKYNLPLSAESNPQLATALMQQTTQSVARSPSTKQLKEQWANGAPRGVDYVRPPAQPPEVQYQRTATLIQVSRTATPHW